jgi:hypothetical protein
MSSGEHAQATKNFSGFFCGLGVPPEFISSPTFVLPSCLRAFVVAFAPEFRA